MTFVHLHIHSHFSLLDGLGKPEEFVARAAELEQPAIALSDHGSLSGAYRLWTATQGTGVKPIIGTEVYYAPLGRTHKEAVRLGNENQRRMDVGGNGAHTHLTLLARTAEGVRNLYRIQAEAYATGFYRKPRADLDLLSQHSEGLICLTGCAGGLVSTYLRLGQPENARAHFHELKDVFQDVDSLFVELMFHDINEPDLNERELNASLIELARDVNAPVVMTNDAHFCHAEDATTHDALLCVQTHAKVSDEKRFRFNGDQSFHLASLEEMREKANAAGIPESAIANTVEIAASVESYDDIFQHQLRMPKWGGPIDDSSTELSVRLSAWAEDSEIDDEYARRLEYERDTIQSLGFTDYFLVVADILNETKLRNIRIGPARGSAGGSLVAYVLGIQSVDPIPSGLLFERFLNPERVGLPDIDIDIQEDRRDEVLAIAREKYGEDCVASLGTFGTIGAKAALKDSARVLGYSYREGEELTWNLPRQKFGRVPGLSEYTGDKTDPAYQLATGLEGTIRSESVHAAAIIISPEPLRDLIPLRRQGGKGHDVAAFDMHEVEDLGFVKTDLLGLRTLKVIDDCLQMLEQTSVDAQCRLPNSVAECTDPATYELLARGDSTGVFQLDGSGMRGLLRQVAPDGFSDISAVLALYRPGPMGAKADRDYAARKRGQQRISYPHPELEEALAPILGDTYGLIVYQEQVLKVLAAVGDYTYGTAELIFNAMRKKQHAKMQAAKPDFIERMEQKGYSSDAIEALWETLVPFADYSFNKSHSTGYGLIAYWTAYLKANHPREWMAALLSNETDNDKLHEYLEEVRRLGIPLLPPDVNDSGATFTPTEEGVRYGLAAIKGVGEKAVAGIVAHRPYRNLADFLARAPSGVLNAGVLAALASSGALDRLVGGRREGLVGAIGGYAEKALSARKAKKGGQRGVVKPRYTVPPEPIDNPLRRSWEAATLGVELSTGSVVITPRSPLTPPEMEWIKRTLDNHPGHQPVRLDLRLCSMDLGCTTQLSAAGPALMNLGKVDVKEE